MEMDILNNSLDSLTLSNEFKLKAKKLGFSNIQEISKTKPKVLLQMEGFDYNWLGELIDFLKAEGKLNVLQKF